MTRNNRKAPCPDCNDTGVLKITTELSFSSTPCHCGATGERARPNPRRRVESATTSEAKYFRGAKLRNT